MPFRCQAHGSVRCGQPSGRDRSSPPPSLGCGAVLHTCHLAQQGSTAAETRCAPCRQQDPKLWGLCRGEQQQAAAPLRGGKDRERGSWFRGSVCPYVSAVQSERGALTSPTPKQVERGASLRATRANKASVMCVLLRSVSQWEPKAPESNPAGCHLGQAWLWWGAAVRKIPPEVLSAESATIVSCQNGLCQAVRSRRDPTAGRGSRGQRGVPPHTQLRKCQQPLEPTPSTPRSRDSLHPGARGGSSEGTNLVDPASGHLLRSRAKPCMSQRKRSQQWVCEWLITSAVISVIQCGWHQLQVPNWTSTKT